MKATLEFNLLEESIEFEQALKGSQSSLIIWELDQWLRNQVKYNPDKKNEDVLIGYETTRNRLVGIMEEYDLTFDNKIFS